MHGIRSWWRGPVAVSYLIILAVAIGLWLLIEPKCAAAVALQPSNLIPLPFLIFVAYELIILLHHLARIFVGELFGLRLLTFACGPFAIRRIRGQTRFSWNNRETMITGTTVFGPKNLDGLGWRCAWLVASGPIATIFVGLFFLMIVRAVDPSRGSIDTLFFSAIAFAGIIIGLRLLLPVTLPPTASYGVLLWDALRGRPTCEVLFLLTALINDAKQGIRPRELSTKMLERGLKLTEKGDLPERATFCLLAYYKAMDRNELELAARYLEEAVARASLKLGPIYSWIMLEKAFYEAFFKRDESAARAAFEQIQDWSKLPHHAWLRVSAALALLQGKPDECQRQAREALDILQSLPVTHQFVIDWLEELITSARVSC
jgi:hypothetical protein